ncbi:MAG: dihydrodipicolinate synthase family protein, partial [bacterium]|nr:dihydrodipicolinate synthase family protein [bacterium]
GVSVPQVCFFARAAQAAGADSIIAMAPARTDQTVAIDMYRRMADCFDGPIMVQNAGGYAPLTGEQIARLIDAVPSIEYVKEERKPGPRHITETVQAAGDRIKTIFGGAAGKNLPDEMRRGANGCMPACEFGDVLTRLTEMWWAGDEAGARALHRRILPLINLESHALVRYILRRRGVISATTERAPGGELDAEDKREVSLLLEALEEGDFDGNYPFGAE